MFIIAIVYTRYGVKGVIYRTEVIQINNFGKIPLYTVVRMRNKANLLNALEHFKTSSNKFLF